MLILKSSATYFVAGQQSKGNHCCISITALNTFMLLTAAYSSATIKRELLLRFHGNDAYANAPEWNILITLRRLLSLYWFQYYRIRGSSNDRNVQDFYATTTTTTTTIIIIIIIIIIICFSGLEGETYFYNSSPRSSTQHALLEEDHGSTSWQ